MSDVLLAILGGIGGGVLGRLLVDLVRPDRCEEPPPAEWSSLPVSLGPCVLRPGHLDPWHKDDVGQKWRRIGGGR